MSPVNIFSGISLVVIYYNKKAYGMELLETSESCKLLTIKNFFWIE